MPVKGRHNQDAGSPKCFQHRPLNGLMGSPAECDDSDNHDETPLLRAQSHNAMYRQTPLPAAQISVLVLPWIADIMVTYSISPYINQVRK